MASFIKHLEQATDELVDQRIRLYLIVTVLAICTLAIMYVVLAYNIH